MGEYPDLDLNKGTCFIDVNPRGGGRGSPKVDRSCQGGGGSPNVDINYGNVVNVISFGLQKVIFNTFLFLLHK